MDGRSLFLLLSFTLPGAGIGENLPDYVSGQSRLCLFGPFGLHFFGNGFLLP